MHKKKYIFYFNKKNIWCNGGCSFGEASSGRPAGFGGPKTGRRGGVSHHGAAHGGVGAENAAFSTV